MYDTSLRGNLDCDQHVDEFSYTMHYSYSSKRGSYANMEEQKWRQRIFGATLNNTL